jgi:hypothetical protein
MQDIRHEGLLIAGRQLLLLLLLIAAWPASFRRRLTGHFWG